MKYPSSVVIGGFLAVAIVSSLVTWQLAKPERTETPAEARMAAADIFNAENRLVVERGSVEIVRADGKKETVKTETPVTAGDAVTVSGDGFAAIHWFDDSVSRLKAGTTMRITTADYAPDDLSKTEVSFEVVKGTVWSKVMDLVNGESSFTAEGAGVVAGVRGTIFNMTVDANAVQLDAVEHASFVRIGDGETRDIKAGETVWLPGEAHPERVKGMQAMRLTETAAARFESDWFVQNGREDLRDAADIRAKHLSRLQAVLGDDRDPKEIAASLRTELAKAEAENASHEELVDLRARLMLTNRVLQAFETDGLDRIPTDVKAVPVPPRTPVIVAPVEVVKPPVEIILDPKTVSQEDPEIRARVDELIAKLKVLASQDATEADTYAKYAKLAEGPVDLALMNEIAGQVARIEKKQQSFTF